MLQNSIDLKNILLLIYDQKDIEANLNLDEGCVLECEDPKPLIKVINYFLNYLNQQTEMPMEIGLELRSDSFVISLLAYVTAETLPPLSDKLAATLQEYHAEYDVQHTPGKYVQIKISFSRS